MQVCPPRVNKPTEPCAPEKTLLVLAQVLAHLLGAVAHGLHGFLHALGRGAEALGPVAQLVILVDVDALAVLAAGFGLVVGHAVLPVFNSMRSMLKRVSSPRCRTNTKVTGSQPEFTPAQAGAGTTRSVLEPALEDIEEPL